MKLKTLNDLLETTPALLDFVAVPSPLSSDYLKALIIEKLGEVEPVHQSAAVFVADGTLWFNTHGWLFTHVINIMSAEYSPIENYNRTEETTETNSGDDVTTHEGTVTDTKTGTDTTVKTGTDTETMTGTEATAHTGTVTEAHTGTDSRTISKDETQKIAGLDSSTFNNANQLIADNGDDLTHGESITTTHNNTDTLTHNTTDQMSHNTTDTLTHNVTDEVEHDTTDTLTHGHVVEKESNIHGNIGVTTNQQMIEQELALVKAFNAYDVIVSVFENDLFITCYNDAFGGDEYEYSGV